MDATPLIIIAMAGLCLGVILATVRIPTIQWIPSLSLLLLGIGVVLGVSRIWEINLLAGLILIITAQAGSFLYSGKLWQQQGLEPGLTYMDWAKRGFLHEGYLRRLYLTERSEQQTSEVR